MIAFDPTPPANAQLWQAPVWQPGDRYALLRGGKLRIEFEVAAVSKDYYTLVDGSGGKLRRGLDLSNLGEWPKEGEEPLHALTPADTRFHWPLWVGKHWRCQYADRKAGGPSMLVETAYEVEDLDTVVTPAGTFQALRIVRTSRLLGEGGTWFDRVNIIWYAPDPGIEVRQLIGEASVELLEWKRASVTSAKS